jgi:hypothetical protein
LIVGGTPVTDPDAYPYFAFSQLGRIGCGATLIAPNVLVTQRIAKWSLKVQASDYIRQKDGSVFDKVAELDKTYEISVRIFLAFSTERELVREGDQIARLLWPPFDKTPRDPGCIKAYPPGIRENGGQYTHAAAWLAWAFAKQGDGNRAMRIFRRINPICHSSTRPTVDAASGEREKITVSRSRFIESPSK